MYPKQILVYLSVPQLFLVVLNVYTKSWTNTWLLFMYYLSIYVVNVKCLIWVWRSIPLVYFQHYRSIVDFLYLLHSCINTFQTIFRMALILKISLTGNRKLTSARSNSYKKGGVENYFLSTYFSTLLIFVSKRLLQPSFLRRCAILVPFLAICASVS